MSSRRAVAIGLVVVLVVGLGVLAAGAVATKSRMVATLGVLPVYPVAPIAAGQEVCQSPIGLADDVARVRFNIGTFGRPGPPLIVTVRNAGGALVLGQGHVAAGWIDNGTAQDVPIGHVAAGQEVSVCIRNRGPVRGYVYGDINAGRTGLGPTGVRPTISTSAAAIDGVEIPGDISMQFVRTKPRSLLARIPAAFRHASVFHPGGTGPWLWWLLAVLILIAAPLGLYRALTHAFESDCAHPPLPSTRR